MEKSNLIILIAAIAAILIAAIAIFLSVKKKKTVKTEEAASDEEKAAENEEITENEEIADDEEIPEEEICPHCGVRRIFEDGDYCKTCEAELKKTKIPFGGWIAGLAILLFTVVAIAQCFLISGPAIQAARGKSYADEESWYEAYAAYSEVDSVKSEIDGIIGGENPFVKIGCGLRCRQVKAVAKAYSPLEAASYIGSVFTAEQDGYVQKNKALREYKQELEDFQSTYNAVTEAGGDMLYDGSKIEDVKKAFLGVKGKEGVNDVFVDYFVCNADQFLAADDIETCYNDFVELEKTAKASGKDYGWLYYQEFAKLCLKKGDTAKAKSLMDEILASDKGNYAASLMKMNAFIIEGDKESAEKVIDEFTKYNGSEDGGYALRTTYFRCIGEYDKVKEICTEAFETYNYVPELHRQLAITFLLQKDYDNAYEHAYLAEESAYYLYSSGDSSGYTNELINTVYVCASLCKQYGTCKSENAGMIDELLESYSQEEVSATAKAIVEGKLSPEKVFSEGVYDII